MIIIKKIIEYFKDDKIIIISSVALYFMILVIIYNFFCYTTGLTSFELNVENIKNIFIIDTLFSIIYTYIGNIIPLLFIGGNNYKFKEYLLLSIPLTIIALILNNFINVAITNIVMILIYFIYFYIKNSKIKTILNTLLLFLIMFIIEIIFYYFKYKFNFIDVNTDNDLLKFILSIDYYLFMLIIIILKNKLIKRK